MLERNGLVDSKRRKPRYRSEGTPLHAAKRLNDLWCADYKEEFMLADQRYCYPLTITDFASRYLLCCDALESTREAHAFTVFERVFKDFGLPGSIRTDNGTPFASRTAFFGLSKLSVWWLRLGINLERIEPGHPTQNGRHERMHLTLKLRRIFAQSADGQIQVHATDFRLEYRGSTGELERESDLREFGMRELADNNLRGR